MSSVTVVSCPRCGQKYRVPSDKIGARARCKKCSQGFRIAEHQPIDDETICGWVTEEDPGSNSVMGSTGVVESPAPKPKEATTRSAFTHKPPPSEPRITLERIDEVGAYFEFPVEWLSDPDLRGSFPHRCVNCLSKTDLRCHLLIWGGKLPRKDAFRVKEVETRAIRRLDQLLFNYREKWLEHLESLDVLPAPFNAPMPYFVCEHCSSVGEITTHTLDHGEREFCQIGIANLTIAVEFFRNNGGRGTTGYQRLLVASRQQRDNEWQRLPFAVRSKVLQWFKLADDETFLGFYSDQDFARAERGASGLVLTDRRMVFKKYAANREYVLERGGEVYIEATKSVAMISIAQPGQREAVLNSHPLSASSFARSLSDMNYGWDINVKTVNR
ncbi:MAG: hypothetical protein KAV82_06245 [Phycisphaerae bacterium]|nr:hypothetical protein [Phycisphaerae bacterium]